MKNKFVNIQTTVNSNAIAEEIAEILLMNQLAACVQIYPIESIYTWKGKIVKDKELRVSIKTRAGLYAQVEAYILENHNYEKPQIIQIPIENGNSEYLKWVEEVTKS